MMHSGYIHDTYLDISKSFQFKPPEKKYWTDLWKGWYLSAYKQQRLVPYIDLMRRERQQKPLEIRQNAVGWTLHGDVEVGLATLVYRFRPSITCVEIDPQLAFHSLVLVLSRNAF